jgi:hypothetical protein
MKRLIFAAGFCAGWIIALVVVELLGYHRPARPLPKVSV